jgi:type VII secretion-associated protein (TIGR03931 family)
VSAAPATEPMAMLVEGRVGVVIPAAWTVRRITDGPGSDRLQAVAPGDEAVALHVTQSALPQEQSLEQIATTLDAALAAQSEDVFTLFRPDDRRAGRRVASYRERRTSGEIAWFVVGDRSVRIAIGCQSPFGRAHLIAAACDAAVRSAHAVF